MKKAVRLRVGREADVSTVSPESGQWTLYVNGEPVANDKMSGHIIEDQGRPLLHLGQPRAGRDACVDSGVLRRCLLVHAQDVEDVAVGIAMTLVDVGLGPRLGDDRAEVIVARGVAL